MAAVDLSSERLDGTAKLAAAGDRLSTHVLNVTDTDAVNALPQAVIDAHGQVDGVLNVAGIIQKFEPFIELETADIERVLQVNFWGVVDMVRAFLPHLLRRPEAALVNVSSMGAFIPVPGQTVYGASKAAVKLLTEGLHAELGDTPVRVTVVFPGAVATGITENSGVKAPAVAGANDNAANAKVLPPSEAAEIIIEGMQKGAYRVLVGRDATVMDWFTRLVPERAMTTIADRWRPFCNTDLGSPPDAGCHVAALRTLNCLRAGSHVSQRQLRGADAARGACWGRFLIRRPLHLVPAAALAPNRNRPQLPPAAPSGRG